MTMYPVSKEKNYQIAVRTNGYIHDRIRQLSYEGGVSMNYYINSMFKIFITQLEKDRLAREKEEKEKQG